MDEFGEPWRDPCADFAWCGVAGGSAVGRQPGILLDARSSPPALATGKGVAIMHRQPVCRPRCCLATCLCAFLAWAPPARGDITSANWVNNTLFNYRVTHMPDLDQRRAGMLDAFGVDCGGSIHCVPTCTTNMV